MAAAIIKFQPIFKFELSDLECHDIQYLLLKGFRKGEKSILEVILLIPVEGQWQNIGQRSN